MSAGRHAGPLPDGASASPGGTSVGWAADRCGQVLAAVGEVVIGKPDALRLVLAAIVAGGHVLIEDNPGMAKTLAARTFATVLGLPFRRLQFTPDMLPSDVTGAYVFNQRDHDFEFRPGPLFTGLLLADELNRTPPKTQAALLEAMQERQVTVEGTTHLLPRPFHVIATSNPIEYEGTYALPEAQLDRFLVRVRFGYPTIEQEHQVLLARLERHRDETPAAQLLDGPGLRAVQDAVEAVEVESSVSRYCVDLARATRDAADVSVGASPRGTLALLLLARAFALIDGRDFVVPDDVKAVAVPVLAHRLTLSPDAWLRGRSAEQVVADSTGRVPTPPTVGP